MYTGIYRIAGRSIAIESLYPDVHAYCAAYRHAGDPDFTIRITPADIDRERDKSAREDQRQGIAPRAFPEGYLEELAVYRQIADRMPAYDTLLIHGSAIALDGAAYLFTARSGTGKSTHTRFWRQTFGSRAVMINDDKPLVGLTDAGAVIYGTPYNGKHRLGENLSAPLQAICILERGAENAIRPISSGEAYPLLLQQVYRPGDPAVLGLTLKLLDGLLTQVRLYRLACNLDPAAAQVAYDGMKGCVL